MSITVHAHITETTEISARMQESEVGKFAVFSAGHLEMLINSRKKLIEISSMLENAAQQWDDEKLLDKEQ